MHISALRFEKISGEGCRMELTNGRNRDTFMVHPGKWQAGSLHLDGGCTDLSRHVFREGLYEKFYVKGCTRGHTLFMDMLFQETSFQDTWEVIFEEGLIRVKVKRNTGFVPVDFSVPAYPA